MEPLINIPIVEFLVAIPPVLIGLAICSFFVRFIYYPLVGRSDTFAAPIVSTLLIIFGTAIYGYWIYTNGYDNGTNAHGYIFALITLPITAGWIGNFIWDIMANFRDKRKGKYTGS